MTNLEHIHWMVSHFLLSMILLFEFIELLHNIRKIKRTRKKKSNLEAFKAYVQ